MTNRDTEIKVPRADLEMQVKLLYCEYGWSVAKIAATLNVLESVVRVAISAGDLKQKDPSLPVVVEDAQEEYSDDVQSIKINEVKKQQQLAPLYAVAEISLLSRIMEQASQPNLPPDVVKSLVDSFKKLTQDSVINAVVRDEKKDGNGPQVAVQILQFKD